MLIVIKLVKMTVCCLWVRNQLPKVLVVSFLSGCHLNGILCSLLYHEELVFLILEL